MKSLRNVGSPSFVIALVALVVAMGGAAWAGVKVGTSQIKNGAITKKKLAKNSVGPKQVIDGSLTAAELADGSLTGAEIADGSLTGAKIDQSTLDSVANADKVGGMKVERFTFRQPGGTALTTVATVGTLQLRAGCNGSGQPQFTVVAASGAPAQTVRASVIKGTSTVSATAQGTIPPAGIDVLDGTDTEASYNGTVDALTADNRVTTVQWAARSTANFPSANPDASNCLFWGTATSG